MFETISQCELPDWEWAESRAKVLNLKAGDYLFHIEQSQPYVFVVTSGVLKMMHETEEGKVWIKGFAPAGKLFASITALLPNGQTSYSTAAITNAEVYRFSHKDLEDLADRHKQWQKFVTGAYMIYGFVKEKRERELLTLSAEQRYVQFLEDFSELESVVPQKDIASYIRVTPVALSRIKARIRGVRKTA